MIGNMNQPSDGKATHSPSLDRCRDELLSLQGDVHDVIEEIRIRCNRVEPETRLAGRQRLLGELYLERDEGDQRAVHPVVGKVRGTIPVLVAKLDLLPNGVLHALGEFALRVRRVEALECEQL